MGLLSNDTLLKSLLGGASSGKGGLINLGNYPTAVFTNNFVGVDEDYVFSSYTKTSSPYANTVYRYDKNGTLLATTQINSNYYSNYDIDPYAKLIINYYGAGSTRDFYNYAGTLVRSPSYRQYPQLITHGQNVDYVLDGATTSMYMFSVVDKTTNTYIASSPSMGSLPATGWTGIIAGEKAAICIWGGIVKGRLTETTYAAVPTAMLSAMEHWVGIGLFGVS